MKKNTSLLMYGGGRGKRGKVPMRWVEVVDEVEINTA